MCLCLRTLLVLATLTCGQGNRMPIGLTDYVKPKNDAFTGIVQASQVLGGGEHGTLPDEAVAASNVTQHGAPYSRVDGTRAFTGVVEGVLPTDSDHLTTKEYVDATAGFYFEYHLTDDASDVDTYFVMQDSETGESLSSHILDAAGAGDDQLIVAYATPSGEPGILALNAGVYNGHFHVERTVGGRTVNVYWTLSKYALDDTETLLMTSEVSGDITSETGLDLHANLTAPTDLLVTDRLVMKIYANLSSTPNNPTTVVVDQEGVTSSHVVIGVDSSVLNNIFVRQDDEDYVALTDDHHDESHTLTSHSDVSGKTGSGTIVVMGDSPIIESPVMTYSPLFRSAIIPPYRTISFDLTAYVANGATRALIFADQDTDLRPNDGSFAAASHAGRHVDGSDDIQNATAAQKGLATAAQISKLDTIADNANLYVHPNHTGDVTSIADGAQTIEDYAVTYAKMQNVSATDKLLGRVTAGAGIVEEIACTAAGRALLDDADASAQRTTLGLGAIAVDAWADIPVKYRTDSRLIYIENPTADSNYPLKLNTANNITVIEVYGKTDSGTVTFNLTWRTRAGLFSAGGTNILTASMVANSSGVTTTDFADATIEAGNEIFFKPSVVGASPGKFAVIVKYTIDP